MRVHVHPTAKVSEQVNRNCPLPPKNTILQLPAPYTDRVPAQ